MRKGLFTIYVKTVVVILLAFGMVFILPTAFASAADETLDSKTIAEINKPGVVYIENDYKAQISVPGIRMSEKGKKTLQQIIYNKVYSGEIANTEAAMTKAFVDEYLKNPYAYIEADGTTQTVDAQTGFTGSGFIVTPDGYIVTNCHVIYVPDDELKSTLAQSALSKQVTQDTEDFIKMVSGVYTPDEAQIKALQEVDYQFYAQNMTLSNVQQSIYCGMGKTIPGIQTIQQGYAVDVRKRGEIIPGKDVAVLKIDKQNLPTVALGDDTGMIVGDKVYVMGYPGVATFNPMIDVNASVTESTFTAGIISARKTMPGGWSVLQFDAAATHGNSGGPVFNDKGEAVGILTFGSYTPQGDEISGMEFAVPISIARQFLNELNITPAESPITADYKKALVMYQKEKYKKALAVFKDINDISPGNTYIQDYIAKCTTNIDAGKDKSNTGLILIAVIAAGVIVIAGVIVLIAKKFSKKPEPKAEPPQPAMPVPPVIQTPPVVQPPAIQDPDIPAAVEAENEPETKQKNTDAPVEPGDN